MFMLAVSQRRSAFILVLMLCTATTVAETAPIPPSAKDPHYTDVGFFDIHVCHWPDRPPFFMSLFSSTKFDLLKQIRVFKPDGSLLVELGLNRYNLLQKKGKPEKRVFMSLDTVPAGAVDGWYSAEITLKDGRRYRARDYVRILKMDLPAAGMNPPHGAQGIPTPKELSWAPVARAMYYKVFVSDAWAGGVIYESKLLKEPRVKLPAGLLKPDGIYSWRVHARDINEDPTLGDFNDGSLSPVAEFTTAP